ncbi:MAG: AAA family ATPase [Campylobacterales bacterium]|nr:AAA family ATPase [Campylobacterales bacterium]
MDYWLLRARWGDDDKTTLFMQNDQWINGYDDKYLDVVKRVQEGDILLLADNSLINYYAVCVGNEQDGRHLLVDSWKRFNPAIAFLAKGAYIKTIAKINHKELIEESKKVIDKFNNVVENIKLYKEKNDNQNSVIYLNELIVFENEAKQKDICKEIIAIHLKSDYENFESDYYRAVYKAWILLGDLKNIIDFGQIAEEKIYYYDVEDLYQTIITDDQYKITKEVFIYLIGRWAKVVVKHQDTLGKNLEDVNNEYLKQCKKYNLPYKPFTIEEVEKISDLPQEATYLPSEHFSYLTIQNFRQFENLILTDIGEFNLIVGDNNVGKTSLLEALMFMRDSKLYYENLAFAYIARNNTSLIKQDINEPRYELSKSFLNDFFRHNDTANEIQFELQEDRNQWTYRVKTPTVEEIKKYLDKDSVIDIDDYTCMVDDKGECNIFEIPLIIKKLDPNDIINMQLIPFGKGFDRTLAKNYYDNIDKDKQKRKAFLESMKVFIPKIERITADTESGDIDIEELDRDESILLHQYGEGANKLFRILIQITLQRGKKLLIDEIDAGIHYSHFKEFWRIILQVAKDNDVQIFATTHNLECIEYFKEILEEEDEYQPISRVITLRRFSNNIVEASTRKFEEFEYELNNEFEIRGGDL